jgi:hypothetical protein
MICPCKKKKAGPPVKEDRPEKRPPPRGGGHARECAFPAWRRPVTLMCVGVGGTGGQRDRIGPQGHPAGLAATSPRRSDSGSRAARVASPTRPGVGRAAGRSPGGPARPRTLAEPRPHSGQKDPGRIRAGSARSRLRAGGTRPARPCSADRSGR